MLAHMIINGKGWLWLTWVQLAFIFLTGQFNIAGCFKIKYLFRALVSSVFCSFLLFLYNLLYIATVEKWWTTSSVN